MKAAVIERGKLELRELPTPNIGSEEILVRMRACGVCGTDIEKVRGEQITPPILGHEVAGEIEDLGNNVREFKKGDRVIVHHHISCGNCFYCKNGLETQCDAYPKSNLDPCGFAEHFRVPEALVKGGTVYHLPDSVGFEEGSQVEPAACGIRALRKAGVSAGNSVAVFGVGPMGLTHVQLLKDFGTAPIIAIDIIENRRQFAAKLGADMMLNPSTDNVPESILTASGGRGVDYAIVATGNPKAIEQACNSVRRGGKVIIFGAPPRGALVSLDVSRLFLREVNIQSSYSTSETEMRMSLDLIESKRVVPSKIITHRFPLSRTLEALQLAEKGADAVKVIVEN
jgi:L-iditol 2-dehydrogenase